VTIENSTFDADTAASSYTGGAVADLGAGELDISGSTFTNDEATTNGGGAIYIYAHGATAGAVTTEISDSTFEDDKSEHGGAVSNDVATGGDLLVIDHSTFENDTATTQDGGAVYNTGGSSSTGELRVQDSSFIANSAADGGAIANGGLLTVGGSEFSGNQANVDGAAIDNNSYDTGGTSSVYQSTFVGDLLNSGSATDGYAIYNSVLNQPVALAANLFVEDCAGTLTSAGYNVSMPATGGGVACASGTKDTVTSDAGDVTSSTQNSLLLEPMSPNPAIDLIPDNASATLGTVVVTLCPVTDLLGNSGPDSSGACTAGAI
jgi:predicted outer membrane repeat protein